MVGAEGNVPTGQPGPGKHVLIESEKQLPVLEKLILVLRDKEKRGALLADNQLRRVVDFHSLPQFFNDQEHARYIHTLRM